jgi:hypothetical protein
MAQFARASAAFLGPANGATQVIDKEIRKRAHQLWEAAGKPEGQEERFWHEAERLLKEEQIKHETKTPDNL